MHHFHLVCERGRWGACRIVCVCVSVLVLVLLCRSNCEGVKQGINTQLLGPCCPVTFKHTHTHTLSYLLGPMNCTGDERWLKSGSVMKVTPSSCTSTVAWPTHIAWMLSAGGQARADASGATTGKARLCMYVVVAGGPTGSNSSSSSIYNDEHVRLL